MKIISHAMRDFCYGAAMLVFCMSLAGCERYNGTITNAPPPAGMQGPPLLTDGYAP